MSNGPWNDDAMWTPDEEDTPDLQQKGTAMASPLSDDETDLACLNCNAGPFDGLLDSCPTCHYDGALVWADEQVRLPDGTLTRKELV